MRYMGMPMGMWLLYKKSFYDRLIPTLGFSKEEADEIISKAKPEYRKIIRKLPEFEKDDIFKMNIVNCALFSAVLLSIDERPDISKLIDYYEKSMMTGPARLFFRLSGRNKFSEKDIARMKHTAELKAADRNPYSWNMDLLLYPDGSGYEARFFKCGICTLMKELGVSDCVPAMCHFDYAMTEAGKTSDFIRKYTLASGGPYCDCGYKKK